VDGDLYVSEMLLAGIPRLDVTTGELSVELFVGPPGGWNCVDGRYHTIYPTENWFSEPE